MDLNEIIEMDKKYFMNTFGSRTPVCFEYGKGINLWSKEGIKYFDFLSGIAVSSLGHSHPKLVNTIKEQAEKLIHCTNLYYIESQVKLAKLIVENSCADKVFFSNSGAEANESAIKLAKIYTKKKGSDRYEFITLTNSFHGRTLTTVAATGQKKYQKPYAPLTPGFLDVPINNLEALKNSISSKTCAIMIEPIQGESGVNPVDIEYMIQLRKICDANDILLIFDEIQTGVGRTGKLFGYEHFGVEPDIFTLAKALGGGFPIGCLCAKDHIAKAFEPGDHGSTFGGNPLACTIGYTVLSTIIEDKLVENSGKMGLYFMEKLQSLKLKYDFILDVRGKGLMIGIEFSKPIAKEVNKMCFENKYLLGSVGDNILRILPPLIIQETDIDAMVAVLDDVLALV